MCYLSTSPLDAGHGYSFELDSNSLSTLRISVRRSAFGEGSLADPVPLALGASHATTFSDGNSSYYAYTTGASPPTMISLLVKTQYGQTYPTSVSPSFTAKCQYEVCLYSGLAPNTTYVFTFRFFDDLPGVVRVLDMDVASGCDAAAATCLDFESGAPPTTQPAFSVDNRTLETSMAANGTQSFLCGNQVNNNEETCFTYQVAGMSSLVWFNLREVSDAAGSLLRVYTSVGGATWAVFAPKVNGQWRRGIASAEPAADQAWTFCYQKNGTGGALDTGWVDDVQFE